MLDRSQLVGFSKSKFALVEAIGRANALNCTGKLDYNMFGEKDGSALQPVTEKVIDNFVFHILIPDYNTKNGKNSFVGSQNKTIRDLLNVSALEKCNVKAITFRKLEEQPSKDMLETAPNISAEIAVLHYYIQEFKIACPNLQYTAVLEFLRNKSYNSFGFYLKDLDVTMDYAGSFDKEELIHHLVKNEGFREQGEDDTAPRTIVDNDLMVGKNCLTFMETIDGVTTRQKVYNKLVQMLECKSVRSSMGCHWKDWVTQKGTRLAAARDKSTTRGLTRAEATFYISAGEIPSDAFIIETIQHIVEYIPKELVYSTPFTATWRAYCSTFQHSLVCIDRSKDVGLVIYSFNELTRNISGHVIESWLEREKWCLDKLTLNGNIPLDVIDILVLGKKMGVVTKGGRKVKRSDDILEIAGSRYFKFNPDHSVTLPTRLVSMKGCFSYNKASMEENTMLMKTAGFVEHENCIPYLAKSQANVKSKANAEFKKVENLEIRLPDPRRKTVVRDHTSMDEIIMEEVVKIEQIRRPLIEELGLKEKRLQAVNDYIKQLSTRDSVHLKELEQGSYSVKDARKENTRYGSQYHLLVELDGNLRVVWGNTQITRAIESLSDEVRRSGDLQTFRFGFVSEVSLRSVKQHFLLKPTIGADISRN